MSHASKKPLKNVSKDEVLPKKLVKKAKVTSRKSPAVSSKKAVKKKTASTTKTAKKTTKINVNIKVPKDAEIVNLPSNFSQRAVEKTKVHRFLYKANVHKVMQIIARSGAYVFIFSGLGILVFMLGILNTSSIAQYSTTVCGDETVCDTDLHLEQIESVVHELEPEIVFESSVKHELLHDTDLVVSIKNTYKHKTKIISRSGGSVNLLTPYKITDGGTRFHYTIPVRALTPGQYFVKVFAVELDKTTIKTVKGPEFIIPDTSTDKEVVEEQGSSDEDFVLNTHEDETTDLTMDTEYIESSSDNSVVVSADSSESKIELDVSESAIEPLTEEVSSSLIQEKTTESENELALELRIRNFSDNNNSRLLILSPETRFVEIYAIKELSTSPHFLGLAERKDIGWVYWIGSTDLPTGSYKIFAQTNLDSTKKVRSNYVSYTSENIVIIPEADMVTDISLKNEIISISETEVSVPAKEEVERLVQVSSDEDVEIMSLDTRSVYYSVYNAPQLEKDEDYQDLQNEIESKVNEILERDVEKLNELLKNYGVALQGKDEMVVHLATKKLSQYKESLILEASSDAETRDLIAQLDVELDNEFDNLQKHVEKFEKVINQRSGKRTSSDTDKDGISDFDEINIYNTDINNPDSDKDGILDGIEIVGGYNPLDVDREAVIKFNSPKGVEYLSTETLAVEAVTALVEPGNSYGVPIQAEIRGKGLPNSYVTLFIYSEPTVVTVKTDDDGSFVYTFTKELQDGEHEVYVAITDNVGGIVARSEPFRFIKTAEAFSPVDVQEASVNISTDNNTSIITSYNMVATMGVVAFGLILLILGQSLRGRQEDVDLEKES